MFAYSMLDVDDL